VSDRFEIAETPLPGLFGLKRIPRSDERGWFERMYDTSELAEVLDARSMVQLNRSLTRARGTVRGLHYQLPPSAEAKLVSCLRGAIFDVAVDLRRGSRTLLQWYGATLDAENRHSLFIPEGFAHGFQALEDETEVLYVTTAAYDPAAERGIHPLEPLVGIGWPLPIDRLSDRDAAFPALDPDFGGIQA
jgi:dTDP-4-dehydrorhamnose 3,5-epimerase